MKIPQVILIEIDHSPGSLATVLQVVGEAGLVVEGLEAVSRTQNKTLWELTLEMDEEVDRGLYARLNECSMARIAGISDRVFTRHDGGKIETISKVSLDSLQILRDVYTPGVARVCLAIRDQPAQAKKYTNIKNTVAIVTNGTAILGLGDIGALAGLPVMEGKAALFHSLAGLSGVPILIEKKDAKSVIDAVEAIAPSFGAIQLEDIAAPECFEIEQELIRRLDIPVLHDDQHGTAVVTLAALLSATRMVGKDLEASSIGQIGLGAAGIGISRLLMKYGVKEMLGTDLNEEALTRFESMGGRRATLPRLMEEADIVVSTTGMKGLIKPEMVRQGHMILALTNPDPEIEPDLALKHGAIFAADGKNVNNVLGFPGLFRGALDAGAVCFQDEMLFAAAESLSEQAPEDQLIPNPLDPMVHRKVALAVRHAAPQWERRWPDDDLNST